LEREIVKVGEDWGLTFDIKEEEDVAKKGGLVEREKTVGLCKEKSENQGLSFDIPMGCFNSGFINK